MSLEEMKEAQDECIIVVPNWVMRQSLIDLGFLGHKFTWKHGRSVENRRAAHLNRALSDAD